MQETRRNEFEVTSEDHTERLAQEYQESLSEILDAFGGAWAFISLYESRGVDEKEKMAKLEPSDVFKENIQDSFVQVFHNGLVALEQLFSQRYGAHAEEWLNSSAFVNLRVFVEQLKQNPPVDATEMRSTMQQTASLLLAVGVLFGTLFQKQQMQ